MPEPQPAEPLRAPIERHRDIERGKPDNQVRFWKNEFQLAEKAEKAWREEGERIVALYRDANQRGVRATNRKRFNILYSNTEILKSASFQTLPEPNVTRRFLDQDDVARAAAETLERTISASLDPADPDENAEDAIAKARDDALLPGRGIVRIRYDAEIIRRRPEAVEVPTGEMEPDGVDPVTGEQTMRPVTQTVHVLDGAPVEPEFEEDDEGNPVPFVEEKVSERVWPQYWYWKDFLHSPARVWEDVWWIRYRHLMTRDELIASFGTDEGNKVKLTVTVGDPDNPAAQDARTDPLSSFGRGEVYEIWDKRARKVRWMAVEHPRMLHLEGNEDAVPPLDLEGFFDTPEPLQFVTTTESFTPVPLYRLYRDQAAELDEVTTRIQKLVRMVKATGIYNQAAGSAIINMAEATDGQLFPVEMIAGLQERGGLDNTIKWWPIDEIVTALVQLMQQREVLKQQIFELTGISDLFRGATKATETARAQGLKAQFGTFRMQGVSHPTARFVRQTMRLMGEVIAELFDPATIIKMTGQAVPEQVMALLRDERMRPYRLDVETDELVRPDQAQQRQEAAEFTAAITNYLRAIAEMARGTPPQAMAVMMPMLMELLKFNVRRFKGGRNIEEVIERTAQQIIALAQQGAQQPEGEAGPSPDKVLDAQVKMATEHMKDEREREELAVNAADAEADRVAQLVNTAISPSGGVQ